MCRVHGGGILPKGNLCRGEVAPVHGIAGIQAAGGLVECGGFCEATRSVRIGTVRLNRSDVWLDALNVTP